MYKPPSINVYKSIIHIFPILATIGNKQSLYIYLAKYFGFRKAYCRLHIKYRWYVKAVIHMLYIFRKKIEKHSSHRLLYKITGVLKMEEIVRNSDKELQDNQEN